MAVNQARRGVRRVKAGAALNYETAGLIELSERELANGNYYFAFILAHTAFEKFFYDSLDTVLTKTHHKWVEDFLPEYPGIWDARILRMYKILTNDDITKVEGIETKQTVWEVFKNGHVFRDKMAHHGARPDKDQTSAFLSAVKQLIDHMEGVIASL